jgi:alpha-tubulin suppressor-like RCC1 family protein
MRSLLGFVLARVVALDVHTTATQDAAAALRDGDRGADHVCALTDDGDAYCWGSNSVGQLGSGARTSIPLIVSPHTAPFFKTVCWTPGPVSSPAHVQNHEPR